jgi:hypothetical protein
VQSLVDTCGLALQAIEAVTVHDEVLGTEDQASVQPPTVEQ